MNWAPRQSNALFTRSQDGWANVPPAPPLILAKQQPPDCERCSFALDARWKWDSHGDGWALCCLNWLTEDPWGHAPSSIRSQFPSSVPSQSHLKLIDWGLELSLWWINAVFRCQFMLERNFRMEKIDRDDFHWSSHLLNATNKLTRLHPCGWLISLQLRLLLEIRISSMLVAVCSHCFNLKMWKTINNKKAHESSTQEILQPGQWLQTRMLAINVWLPVRLSN